MTSVMFIDFIFAVTAVTVGAVAGWWLRSRTAAPASTQPDKDAQHAREVLARLHELAAHVAADVGEHTSRVEEINEGLTSTEAPEADEVVSAVDQLLAANNRMQEQLASADERLQEQARLIECHAAEARTDALTRLANRRAMDDEIDRLLAQSQRQGTSFSLIILDVDHFKRFNDTHGHRAGDEVLRDLAEVLRRSARKMDMVARYGGEEFAIILPGASVAEAGKGAERVRRAIEAAVVPFDGKNLHVTVSLGVANLLDGEDSAALIQRADSALYAAKGAGRNRTHWHDGRQIHPFPVKESPPEDAPSAETPPPQEAAEEKQPEPKQTPADPSPPSSEGDSQPAEAGPAASDKHHAARPQTRHCTRKEFSTILRHRLAEWKRGGARPSVLLIKVDGYCTILSRYGKQTATLVLRTAAQFLGAAIRDMDVVTRHDAATFGVLLPGARLLDTVGVAERLREAIASCQLPIGDSRIQFTVSLSGAEANQSDDAEGLVARCEEALDAAVTSGGNCSYYHNGQWSETAEAALERVD